MSTKSRKYELKARAERQSETRRRITEATVALHQEVGPARTTVAEVARRAGVQRLTVYNHFPDERDLMAACQAHFFADHPAPDLGAPLAEPDPGERLRGVLRALYAWYAETERMSANVLRDAEVVPALADVLEPQARMQEELAGALAAGWGARGGAATRLRAALALAIDFWTWRRLRRAGLDDRAAADLMVRAVAGVSERCAPGG